MIVDTPEQTNGYAGLYGEVVTEDCYRLKSLSFKPDVIFDLGANIGVFTRYARSLFPDALILAVEPDEENCTHFRKFTNLEADPLIVLLHTAIGRGPVWHYPNPVTGAHAVYVTPGPAYPEQGLKADNSVMPINVTSIMLDKLMEKSRIPEGKKVMLKIDIEGNEQMIFSDPPSVEAMKRADFIAMEWHPYALTGDLVQPVKDRAYAAFVALADTHDVESNDTQFFATKRTC